LRGPAETLSGDSLRPHAPRAVRNVVFVVGMGRSGTSALTRVLSLCGAALPLQTLPANFGNPTGYWEPELALRINDRFLQAHASSWYDAKLRLPAPSVAADDEAELVAHASALLAEGFEQHGPIVVKDPRISALLPYWTAAAAKAGLRTSIVLCFRDPDEVAASLDRRDALPAAHSRALWLKYNLMAERDSRAFDRVFVAYDDVLSDWERVVERCAGELGLPLAISERARASVADFLSADLRHHAAPAEARADGVVDGLVARTYALLNRAKERDADDVAFDAVFAAYAAVQDAEPRDEGRPPAAARTSSGIRERYDTAYYVGDGGERHDYALLRGRKLEDPRLAAVHALAAVQPGGRVLDLGCGRGELARAFARDGAVVTAVDYSPHAIALARTTAEDASVRFVCADATAFEDAGGYDVAVASGLAEHLAPDELTRLFRNVAAMLHPAGSLVLRTSLGASTPNERATRINEQRPNLLRRQLSAAFPHVVAWLASAGDPRGSLARRYGLAEARAARDVYAVASHRPLDAASLLARITTAPLDAGEDGVRLCELEAPARVVRGERFVAGVRLDNGGGAVLSGFGPNPVRFAYLWLDARGKLAGGDRGRSALWPAARPGDSARYAVIVTAPDEPGRYRLRLTLVQELVRWYATATGVALEVT
jgi:2-polyprenyl-3-methyl-5-hydroxy-6-metoxy-1,4-benzoquinol methylase